MWLQTILYRVSVLDGLGRKGLRWKMLSWWNEKVVSKTNTNSELYAIRAREDVEGFGDLEKRILDVIIPSSNYECSFKTMWNFWNYASPSIAQYYYQFL